MGYQIKITCGNDSMLMQFPKAKDLTACVSTVAESQKLKTSKFKTFPQIWEIRII